MFSFHSLAATFRGRRLTFLLPFCFFVGAAHAQTQTPDSHKPLITLSPEDKVRGLNGAQTNFYFALDSDTEYQNAGFFGQRLRPYLAGNAEALDYLDSYRRQKTLLIGERLVFFGAVAFYGQQVLSGDKQVYFNSNQKVAIGLAAASLLSNLFISRNTNQHFQRAVATHNSSLPTSYREVLRRLAPTAVGITAPSGQPQLAMRWNLR